MESWSAGALLVPLGATGGSGAVNLLVTALVTRTAQLTYGVITRWKTKRMGHMPGPIDLDDRELGDSSLMDSAKRALSAIEKVVARRLSLGEYVSLLQNCERPTAEQIQAFVGFVCSAHSWYKHLPLHPPGLPFHFFAHPWAGMDIVLLADRRIAVQERIGEHRFHYSWMPTTQYRERFGCISYHTSGGSSFFLGEGIIVNPRSPGPMLFTSDGAVALPDEVLEAGRVLCTGVIHPYADLPVYWTWHKAGPWREAEWPEEYGGEQLKQRIIHRIEHPEDNQLAVPASEMKRAGTHLRPYRWFGHGKLCDILTSERKRQTDAMRDAILRVCDLVWG